MVIADIAAHFISQNHALTLTCRKDGQVRMIAIVVDCENLSGLTLFPSTRKAQLRFPAYADEG